METYETHIKRLLQVDSSLDAIVEDLEDLQDSDLLRKLFHEHMTMIENEKLFDFKNIFFCYTWDTDISAARASDGDDYLLLSYNPVFLKSTFKQFSENREIIDFLLKYLQTEKSKVFLNQVGIFWLVQRALFYHEHAHFIQFQNPRNFARSEKNQEVAKYSASTHSLELDADIYSAYCTASHVISNLLPQDESKNPDSREVLEMMLLNVAVLFCFISSIRSNLKSFYVEERSHPHPSIRVVAVMDATIDYFKVFIDNHVDEDTFDENLFRSFAIEISQGLIDIIYKSEVNLKLKEDFTHYFYEITDHYNNLIKKMSTIDKMATIERNVEISKLSRS